MFVCVSACLRACVRACVCDACMCVSSVFVCLCMGPVSHDCMCVCARMCLCGVCACNYMYIKDAFKQLIFPT